VRVFNLAREFGLENEAMVAKVQNLGFSVRNYMSGLEVEDAQRVRRLLEKEREANTVEEHIRPTVTRRRTKAGAPAKPVKKRGVKADEAAAEPTERKTAVRAVAGEAAIAAGGAVAEQAAAERAAFEEADSEKPAVAETGITAEDFGFVEPPEGASVECRPEGEAAASTGETAEQRAQLLRPSSEAPMIRRRIQAGGEEDQRDKGGARRRQVESREIVPQRRVAVSTAFGGTPGRKRRMAPGKKGKKTEITVPRASKRVIRIEAQISLQELAKRMSIKSTELLMKLIGLGMAGININSTLDLETAKIVAEEFGYDVENVALDEDDLLAATRGTVESVEDAGQRIPRPPIVTMMGHVDHGKTSLLDAIRKTKVAAGEAGGITQHVGAYQTRTASGIVSFIDTPGHEAFTAMRARGANVTDIVVLVTAADDGVMPQTIEAINHSRAAGVPIIVAINKCDLPGANTERTRRMLMEHNLLPEELGGQTIIVEVSAKTGAGIDKLLEMISLQAEVMELSANPVRAASGSVLEAYLDRGRGPVANIIVQEGTLRTGDIMVAGPAHGKIRAMADEAGRKVTEAGPSMPVEVLGLDAVPSAGDTFDVVTDMRLAEKVAESRAERRAASQASSSGRPSLEALYQQMQQTDQVDLKLIIKSDVQGTMEALRDSLTKLSGEKVKVTVVHASVGGITESDVLLAATAGAIIIGFNVRPAGKAKKLAAEQNVDLRVYSIIYEVVDAVKLAMVGLLAPVFKEEALGQAEVREVFTIPKVGTIAGSHVIEGKVVRNARARLIRDAVQIWEGRLSSLRRFKDDAREVAAGFECGISLEGYNDIKPGDVIEVYTEKQIEATLG
jgi:translation initiation factor IF-2